MNTILRKLSAIALALTMLLSVIPLSAMAQEYPTIMPGMDVTFELNETVTEAIYAFTPEENGVYRFYTYDNTHDTYGYLLDADGNVLDEDDDGANSGNNFLIVYEMTAGTTYLLKAQFYTVGAEGSMTLMLEKAAAPTAITIKQGDTFTAYPVGSEQFAHMLEPVGSATLGVTWTSDDPNVVNMTENGYARFTKPGTATVTASTAEGLTAACEVTVLDPLPLKAGETVTATCDIDFHVTYSFVPEKTATYAFFAESEQYIPYAELRYTNDISFPILAYDENQQDYEFRLEQELTARTEYYLYICGQLSEATFDVTAEEVVPATAMTLNYTTYTGYRDGSVRLKPVYTPQNAIYETITWESSDDTVVSVNENGVMCFLKEGTATVTATSENGFTASCEVTVDGYPTISLCKTETVTIGAGGSTVTYLFTPKKTGNYAFYAESDYDTVGYVYDATGETELFYNDDYDENRDFCVEATLDAGTTYQLKAQFYNNTQTGPMDLTIVMTDGEGNVIHDVPEYVITDDSHSGVCDSCGTSVNEAHSYDENGLCVCGRLHIHAGTEYEYDTTVHRYTCACGETVEEDHIPDTDGNCVCGYFVHEHEGAFFYDSYSHWGDCTVCNQHIQEVHIYDENDECLCGYFVHTHDTDAYDYDATAHWSVCNQCSIANGSREEHNYGYSEDGACICGKTLLSGAYIGNTVIDDGEYLDRNGNITTEAPTGGYAHYKDGVLTLHNFSCTGAGSDRFGTACLVYAETDLELVLEGHNYLHSLYGDGIHVASADLTVSGDGTLAIRADDDYDGIDVNGGELTIESGTLNIDATDHGIEVEGDLYVNGGTITIVAGDDGFDINGDGVFNGGVIDIDAEDNGIDSYYDITVNGGMITIYTHDDNGIEAANNLTVNGGEFEIDANDECFNAVDGTITVSGGEFILNAGSGDAVMMAGTDIVFAEAMGTFETTTDDYGYIVLADENGDMAQSVTITSTDTEFLKAEWITLSQTTGAYTGETHTPTVTVVNDDGETLVKDTDYTLSWSADAITDVGVYTVTVTGMGAYSGTKLKTYTVYEDVVYVGDAILTNGDYLDNSGNITSEAPAEGGYAHYADGVLTLNDFTFEGVGYVYDKKNDSSAAVFTMNDLTIELVGDNTIITEYDGIATYADLVIGGKGSLTIACEYGIGNYGGDITINSGALNITAADDAIWAYGDVNILDGKLTVRAGSCGIYADCAVNIRGGELTFLDAEAEGADNYYGYGIYADHDDITISGGTIAIDTECGIYNYDYSIFISGGTLDITGEYGIWADYYDVVIDGGVVTIDADYGIYAYYDIYIEGGSVTITSTQEAVCAESGINIHEDVMMTVPENGSVEAIDGCYYIVDENGVVATELVLELPLLLGDIDADGTIGLNDATRLFYHVNGLLTLVGEELRAADMNGDGLVNLNDATNLFYYVNGLLS